MVKEMGEEKKIDDVVEEPQSSSQSPTNLQQVIELITSLLTRSYSIKVFHGKWQLIRNKLEELNSGLSAAENCDFGGNSTFSELTQSILATVKDCYALVNQCVNLSYSGKLLMQSDIDLVSSKFDAHLRCLAGLYNAGVLSQGHAIIVSRPSIGASRDDMKFYIMDLMTRLKVGGCAMKRQALEALNEVIEEDEKYVRIVVDTDEIISILVNFLEIGAQDIQEKSAKAVSLIAGFDSYKGVLIGAGVVASLIRVLESGSELGKERAARVLQKLTENSENAWSVSAQGGVTAVLRICSSGESKGELIGAACGVLKNLSGVEEIKRFIVEEGAVSTFIKLIGSKDEVLQMNAIEFLQTMASGDEPIRHMLIREGVIYSLVRVLDPKSSISSKSREIALRTIETLCFSSTNSLNTLMGYGFLDQLLFFLHSCEISVQELAVKLTYRLCGTSEEIKKAMGDKGFMTELVQLLDARSFEIREMAAEALSNMVLVPRNRRRFIGEDCNVGRILQLLNPEEGKSGNKRFLLLTIMSLTSCNNGRRKIAHSSYLKNLEKLSEAGVIDAKRIIKKLSTNRILSILSGIWNS